MIKAIIFDYDGTLSNRVQSAYRKYKDDVIKLFPYLDPNSYELEAIVQRCMTWDEYGTINKAHVYERLKKAYDLDIDVDECVKKWYETFHEYQVLQPNCFEVLSKLKEKYRLACVTNGNAFTQNIKLDYTDLRKEFEFVLVSGEFGVHKPEKEIFLKAAELLDLNPSEIAFIGDTFATDILGAYRVGMLPIWFFNDPLRFSDIDVTRIYAFEELLDIF